MNYFGWKLWLAWCIISRLRLLMKHTCTSGSVAIQSKPHKEIKCLIFFLGKFFLTKLLIDLCYPEFFLTKLLIDLCYPEFFLTKLLIDLCYPFKASIGMHMVHTALYAFLKVLIRRLFNQQSRGSLVGDHFLYCLELNIWCGTEGN